MDLKQAGMKKKLIPRHSTLGNALLGLPQAVGQDSLTTDFKKLSSFSGQIVKTFKRLYFKLLLGNKSHCALCGGGDNLHPLLAFCAAGN